MAKERKVVSVLFVDLVGFTAQSESADPEDVDALLRGYHRDVRHEIERYGGTVEKFIGDAVVAVFGAPVAHEDDPERAVRAALRILDATDLDIRIAVNTGEVLVDLDSRPEQGEGMVTGDAVNTASRLQGAAPLRGILVGEATHAATARAIEYEELEPVELKGKSHPLAVWQAVAARSRLGIDVDAPAAAPFVGRRRELELLQQLFERCLDESGMQLVTIVGEPGAGKTRLVGELRAWVDERPEIVLWRQGRCLPYGEGIAYWPVGEAVKAQAGILESDDLAATAAKLDLTLEGMPDPDWLRARLAPLLGLEAGSGSRDESFAAWRTFFEELAARSPLVLIVEDLHWADPAMLEFVEYLVEWSAGEPMLVIATARPELFERNPGWGGGKRNATTISLSSLSDEDTARLVAALLERSVLPAETQALLLERAGGNPLFAEEFVRMLRDRGVDDAVVPGSVQALIAARLDTLDAARKQLVHDAAVVGKVFWGGAVAAISGSDRAHVRSELHELVRKELVKPARLSSVEGEQEYVFWHALVRDVAYGQIPRADRIGRHVAAAEWIERVTGDRVGDHAEILAHHYLSARANWPRRPVQPMPAPLRSLAVDHLVVAGQRTRNVDSARAVQLLIRATDLLDADDPRLPTALAWAARTATEQGDFERSRALIDDAYRRRSTRATTSPSGSRRRGGRHSLARDGARRSARGGAAGEAPSRVAARECPRRPGRHEHAGGAPPGRSGRSPSARCRSWSVTEGRATCPCCWRHAPGRGRTRAIAEGSRRPAGAAAVPRHQRRPRADLRRQPGRAAVDLGRAGGGGRDVRVRRRGRRRGGGNPPRPRSASWPGCWSSSVAGTTRWHWRRAAWCGRASTPNRRCWAWPQQRRRSCRFGEGGSTARLRRSRRRWMRSGSRPSRRFASPG